MRINIRALKIIDYSKEDLVLTYVVKIGNKFSVMDKEEFNQMINGGLFGEGAPVRVEVRKVDRKEMALGECKLFAYFACDKNDLSALDEKTLKFYFETAWTYGGKI